MADADCQFSNGARGLRLTASIRSRTTARRARMASLRPEHRRAGLPASAMSEILRARCFLSIVPEFPQFVFTKNLFNQRSDELVVGRV